MDTIKHDFENYSVDYEEVKNPGEAINNIQQIINEKYISIVDNRDKITNLEFTKTFRSLIKKIATPFIIAITLLCVLFTKDVITSGICFGALSFFEITLLTAIKPNKKIDTEIDGLNLDIQRELSEIDELYLEMNNLQKLKDKTMGQATDITETHQEETHQAIKPIEAYPKVKNNPKRRERVPEKVGNNPNNNQ